MSKKWRGKIYGPAWWREAFKIAMGFCPQISPCAKCGYPVASGYCCQHCETTNPDEPG